jgi:hypothetical protein
MAGFEKLKADSVLRRKFNLDGSYPYFRMLKRQANGQVDSWAIRWYTSVFLQDGYVVFPKCSLVQHEGYDDTATHATRRDQASVKEVAVDQVLSFPNVVCDQGAYNAVCNFFRAERSLLKRLIGRIGFE